MTRVWHVPVVMCIEANSYSDAELYVDFWIKRTPFSSLPVGCGVIVLPSSLECDPDDCQSLALDMPEIVTDEMRVKRAG